MFRPDFAYLNEYLTWLDEMVRERLAADDVDGAQGYLDIMQAIISRLKHLADSPE